MCVYGCYRYIWLRASFVLLVFFFFQAEDGIRDLVRSRGLGDVYKRQPAALLFNGEAYRGLDAKTLDTADLRFAQRHLRMLSGLYGVLRPMDIIAPHRLEMGTKLSMGRGRKDLYALSLIHI